MRPRPLVISRVFQLNLLEAAIRLINPFARRSAYFVAGCLSRINGNAALIPPDTHGRLRKPGSGRRGGRIRVYGHARPRDLISRISKNPRSMASAARDPRARIRIAERFLPLSGIIWVEPRLDPGSGISTAAVSNIVRSNIHGPLHPQQFGFGFRPP